MLIAADSPTAETLIEAELFGHAEVLGCSLKTIYNKLHRYDYVAGI